MLMHVFLLSQLSKHKELMVLITFCCKHLGVGSSGKGFDLGGMLFLGLKLKPLGVCNVLWMKSCRFAYPSDVGTLNGSNPRFKQDKKHVVYV